MASDKEEGEEAEKILSEISRGSLVMQLVHHDCKEVKLAPNWKELLC